MVLITLKSKLRKVCNLEHVILLDLTQIMREAMTLKDNPKAVMGLAIALDAYQPTTHVFGLCKETPTQGRGRNPTPNWRCGANKLTIKPMPLSVIINV